MGNILPSLNKGASADALVERVNASDLDNMFTVDKDGVYAISLYRSEMKMICTAVPYPDIFLVGDGCPSGWDMGKAIELTWNPAEPNVFVAECELKGGEIKFYTERDWNTYAFRPMVADGSITSDAVQVYKGGDDLKWRIKDDQAGNYRITLDVNKMKIKFEKL